MGTYRSDPSLKILTTQAWYPIGFQMNLLPVTVKYSLLLRTGWAVCPPWCPVQLWSQVADSLSFSAHSSSNDVTLNVTTCLYFTCTTAWVTSSAKLVWAVSVEVIHQVLNHLKNPIHLSKREAGWNYSELHTTVTILLLVCRLSSPVAPEVSLYYTVCAVETYRKFKQML